MTDAPPSRDAPTLGRFIVGMPRAGTMAMVRALSRDPEVAAFGETLFFGRNWIGPGPDGRIDRSGIERQADVMSRLKLQPVGPDGMWPDFPTIADRIASEIRAAETPLTPTELFGRITGAVLSLTGRSYWVEKTPHHMMYLDRILEHLPDSRFVIMVRDPTAFLQSYKQQGDRMSGESRHRFHRLYHPAMASLVAKRTCETALRAIGHEQALLVRLEDLTEEPDVWLLRIREHLRLPTTEHIEYARHNSSFAEGKVERRPLSRAEQCWLRRLAGPSATRLGYDVQDLSNSPISLALSAATLPWWALRNLRTLAKLDQGGLRPLIRRWLG